MRLVSFAFALSIVLAPVSRAGAAALPFTADDARAARAQASARKLPLFIEAWVPW